MGAVLWSILALIFVLLSLPNASREDHARGYYSELLLAARGHGRRIRSSEDGDIASGTINPIAQGWSCEECEQNGSRYYDTLEEGFLAGINESIQSLFQQYTGPLLVHAGAGEGDVLLYWKGGSIESRKLKCIQANRYRQLKILSHFPVEATAIALGNVNDISGAIQGLRQRLNKSRSLLNLTENQEKLLRMVNESLSGDGSSILDSLKGANYAEPLRQIARDAVNDYLSKLNTTIEMLNMATVPDTIIIYHRQFAYPESFIVQYYKLLFNYDVRIVLRPTFDNNDNNDEYCSSDINCSTANISDILAASLVPFERNITATFNGLNGGCNSSVHNFMDAQTKQIICEDLKFGFEACPRPDSSLPGFETRTEKAYVVLFVFFGACSVMLGIVLLAICYEDRVMKAEGKLSSGDKMLHNRDRCLSGISVQSEEG